MTGIAGSAQRVSRRTGGLEKEQFPLSAQTYVSRRTGGLEIVASELTISTLVSRRTGGLEKNRGNSFWK